MQYVYEHWVLSQLNVDEKAYSIALSGYEFL